MDIVPRVVAQLVLAAAVASALGAAGTTPHVVAQSPSGEARHPANVQQLMRGTLFPYANVVFAAQSEDPGTIERDPRPSASTDPLKSAFGGWEAVGNSALALTESAGLFEIERRCSNGKAAPIRSATWKKALKEMRAAGIAAFNAAESKSQDGVLEASDKIAAACATCHNVYRNTPRCVE